MKYNHYPLPQSYLSIINELDNLKLVIVGKDPFPKNPTGIPFCKFSWDEQLMDNNSGFHALRSLGINLDYAKSNYINPQKLFHKICSQGIVFLNCSYHFLGANGLPTKDHNYVDKALLVNAPIIRNANNVLLCGEAKILKIKIPDISCFHKAVHPDIRNRGLREEKWHEWWAKDAIMHRFGLNLNKEL